MFNLEDTGSAEAEKIDGDIAQLGERLPCKQEVAGSNPTISTKRISVTPHSESFQSPAKRV